MKREEPDEMNRNENFIGKYKELEKVARKTYSLTEYNQSVAQALIKRPDFENFITDLNYCADVRIF